MFVGHYGPSFAGKALGRSVPVWVLFVAVQSLDVFWSIFVLLGIEKVLALCLAFAIAAYWLEKQRVPKMVEDSLQTQAVLAR